jgi:hypothetical protein
VIVSMINIGGLDESRTKTTDFHGDEFDAAVSGLMAMYGIDTIRVPGITARRHGHRPAVSTR